MMTHISRNAPQQPVVPSETHRWVVDNQDTSMKFHQFRERCLQLDKYLPLLGFSFCKNGLIFKFCQLICSPRIVAGDATRRNKRAFSGDSFNPVQLLRIKETLANFIDDVIDEDKVRMQLLDLCETLNDYERGVLCAIVGLIPTIYDCNMRSLSEAHFSASYIHPLMTGLFSCKRPSKVAHSSNIVADENATISNNRPDYKVDVYEAYEYAYTNVYGEIKLSKNISSSLLVNDFCRVAISCKDACDELKMLLVSKLQDQLYTFTEIAAIDIPMKKSELLNFVG
ncbi:hypothetical protein VTP01DRAFT_1672 [Rhizomucor pusillus]|uniref:uncharacterized protein n=1 Tax=Rhizomucor pusillus TaxID=4840 RepID=UPI00374349AF